MQPAARGLLAAQLAHGSGKAAKAEAEAAPLLRPSRADSSDDDAGDEQWVPVPRETVEAWREAALSGAALQRGQSLDDGKAVHALTSAASALRMSASCGNLAAMGAPPAPFPKLPPLIVPAAPSMSSFSGCVGATRRVGNERVCARAGQNKEGRIGAAAGGVCPRAQRAVELRACARRGRASRHGVARAAARARALSLPKKHARVFVRLWRVRRVTTDGCQTTFFSHAGAHGADALAPATPRFFRSGSDGGNSFDGTAKAAAARSSAGASGASHPASPKASEHGTRRASSPGGWWSPKIAKRLRRTPSLSRLCGGDPAVAESP
jgi:hypothetical protein